MICYLYKMKSETPLWIPGWFNNLPQYLTSWFDRMGNQRHYCCHRRFHADRQTPGACSDMTWGRTTCGTSDTRSFCQMSVSACGPSGWTDQQMLYHSEHSRMVFHQCGCVSVPEVARDVKTFYHILHSCGSTCGWARASLMLAYSRRPYHSVCIFLLIANQYFGESACVSINSTMLHTASL